MTDELIDEIEMRVFGTCSNGQERAITIAVIAAHEQARGQPEPCTVCNALIVERNPTHYDADDLAAAQVRGKLLAQSLNVEARGQPERAALMELVALKALKESTEYMFLSGTQADYERRKPIAWANARAALAGAGESK